MILSVPTFVYTKTMRFQKVESTIKMKGTVLGPTNLVYKVFHLGMCRRESEWSLDFVSSGMVCMPFDSQFWFLFK